MIGMKHYMSEIDFNMKLPGSGTVHVECGIDADYDGAYIDIKSVNWTFHEGAELSEKEMDEHGYEINKVCDEVLAEWKIA